MTTDTRYCEWPGCPVEAPAETMMRLDSGEWSCRRHAVYPHGPVLAIERCVYAREVAIESALVALGDVDVFQSADGARYLGRARMAEIAPLVFHGWLA